MNDNKSFIAYARPPSLAPRATQHLTSLPRCLDPHSVVPRAAVLLVRTVLLLKVTYSQPQYPIVAGLALQLLLLPLLLLPLLLVAVWRLLNL